MEILEFIINLILIANITGVCSLIYTVIYGMLRIKYLLQGLGVI